MLGEQVKSVALFKRAVFAGAPLQRGSKQHRSAVVAQGLPIGVRDENGTWTKPLARRPT